MNGLYDTYMFHFICPSDIITLEPRGKQQIIKTTTICSWQGRISYPLYMIHHPFIYLYFAWVRNENLTFTQSLRGAIALVLGCIILAYLCLNLYDELIRKYHSTHFLSAKVHHYLVNTNFFFSNLDTNLSINFCHITANTIVIAKHINFTVII